MHMDGRGSMLGIWGTFMSAGRTSILALAVWLSASMAWAGPPTDRIKETFDGIIKVLNDPNLKPPEKKNERNDMLRRLAKELFDEEELAKRALGPHWREISPEERQEFVELFNGLLERTYFKKIDTYLAKGGKFSKEDVIYISEKVKEPYAVVETRIKTDDGSPILVYYRLKNKQDTWLVCDIAVEGVSIVKNYRVQFNEILANSSFEDLLSRLKSKEQG